MSLNPSQLDRFAAQRVTPASTYRLQFNRDFTFAQAASIADYLRDLGVTDAYASPLFQAAPDSTHGYDICSFGQFNPVLGTRQDFDAWTTRLRELGLGLLLDMVPNHMATDLSNGWWLDVLEHGRRSPFANHFDIDWQPPCSDLRDKVLLPILEDHYAKVLDSGKLRLTFDDGRLAIAYHDRKFPVSPAGYAHVLGDVANELERREAGSTLVNEVRTFIKNNTSDVESGSTKVPPAHEQVGQWRQASSAFARSWDGAWKAYNGQPGKPQTFDKLHSLIACQHYRLAFWRVGPELLNYRRFFDVTQLAGVRMELPGVFDASHQLVFELLKGGQVTGLRIDHPDGLWDPQQYFKRLQAGFLLARIAQMENGNAPSSEDEAAVSDWLSATLAPLERSELHRPFHSAEADALEAPRSDPLATKPAHPAWPLYIVAEKILSGDEPLRQDWAVEGTTGYDFLNQVNGLFVDSRNSDAFDRIYSGFTGMVAPFEDVVFRGKQRILEVSLVSELNSLAHRLTELARKTRYGQDYTFRQIKEALAAIIEAFPVYRTYITSKSRQVAPLERFHIEQALAGARARHPDLEPALLEFIQDLLLLRAPADFDDESNRRHRDFNSRFQQLTGPVTAKGLEDTAFYNYYRLVSLNEVGGEPDRFGVTLEQFHHHNALKAEQWPHSLLATATHDTKRGEDVRARLNVLSEIPVEWEAAVHRWSHLNSGKKAELNDQLAPSANDEYLIYQTLVGAWPSEDREKGASALPDLAAFRDRITAYMNKALRESKARTNWTDPDEEYEQGTARFIGQILDPEISRPFLEDLRGFQAKAAFFGRFNSLSQVLLKITCPGVPDFYQGTELWDLSLVDPDNRRPVDYDTRRQRLAGLKRQLDAGSSPALLARQLLDESHTGTVKMFVTFRALNYRREHRELFQNGVYLPIPILGAKSRHVCAFARRLGEKVSLTVVPRLVVGLVAGKEQPPCGDIWEDTHLDLSAEGISGSYTNVLTGEQFSAIPGPNDPILPLRAALGEFPVALFERASD